MPLPKETCYTIEDIYNLPDGERAELIDGQIYFMAPPSYRHQEILFELSLTIGNYIKSKKDFKKIMKKLNMEHNPHDTRHTFITKAKDTGINEYILKLIVGHEIQDITEKVYTHRTLEDMRNEIEKIR